MLTIVLVCLGHQAAFKRLKTHKTSTELANLGASSFGHRNCSWAHPFGMGSTWMCLMIGTM